MNLIRVPGSWGISDATIAPATVQHTQPKRPGVAAPSSASSSASPPFGRRPFRACNSGPGNHVFTLGSAGLLLKPRVSSVHSTFTTMTATANVGMSAQCSLSGETIFAEWNCSFHCFRTRAKRIVGRKGARRSFLSPRLSHLDRPASSSLTSGLMRFPRRPLAFLIIMFNIT